MALESAEEVAAHLKEEDKLRVVALVAKYNKVLIEVKVTAQSNEATYDTCAEKDKVVSTLVTTHEVELKEFQE